MVFEAWHRDHLLGTLALQIPGDHNMRDAIRYGNRLIMLHAGRIILDISGQEKKDLTVPELLEMFARASGDEFSGDRAILA